MKKIFLLAVVCFTLEQGFAQCIPDVSIVDSGIYPDSATGLPHAYVGVAYSADIQVRVPVDTIYFGLPAIIDSINVINVTGMPAGFTYSCTPSRCSFPGGSNGCMLLQSSNPALNLVGVHPIVVEMTVYGRIFGTPQNIPSTNDNYAIVIENNVAVISPVVNTFSVGQNVPNPSKNLTEIPLTMVNSGYVNIKITDLIGKVVYTSKVFLQKGNSNIPLNTSIFNKGLYIYTITNGINTASKRMIIAGE